MVGTIAGLHWILGLFKQRRLASVQAGGAGASAVGDEMHQGAMSSVRRTLFLNTTGEFFWRWLEKYVCTIPDRHHTSMIAELNFPTEDGRILHIVRSYGPCTPSDQPPWSLCGILAEPSETFEEAEVRARRTGDNWLDNLIWFDSVQLAPERLEVTTGCNPPDCTHLVMDYFEELLTEMEKRWPDVTLSRGRVLPDGFPKKPETITRYKKAYLIMSELRGQYRESYDEFLTSTPTPTTQDYKDALASKMGWRPCDKTIRRIKKFGDEGLLR